MTKEKRESAKAYLLQHPTATNSDVSNELGISTGTVKYARSELMSAGLIPPARNDRKSAQRLRINQSPLMKTPTEGTPFDLETTKDLNEAVANALAEEPLGGDTLRSSSNDEQLEDDFSAAKMKRILWRIAQFNTDDRIRTSAIWTLTRIQQEMDSRPPGPQAPTTFEAIVERLLLIFEGVGPAVVIEAMQRFLAKRKGTSNAGQLSTDKDETTQSTSGTPIAQGSESPVQTTNGESGTGDLGTRIPTDGN